MPAILTSLGESMKRDQDYIDAEGKTWITSAKAAEIWNQRARDEHKVEGHYTRWSVYQRREKLKKMDTPLGDLYLEEEIRSVGLRPHPRRPDVTTRHRERRLRKAASS